MHMIYKTVASSDGSLEFVLSDNTVDRYGDIIDAAGWVLANFKKNPIALFGHSSSFPIGTWANVRVDGNRLLAKLNLAVRGTSARIDELISLVEQGILRAVSVGFYPIKSEPIDKDRPYGPQRYTKQELLETSLVSVPANPAALLLAKSLNISDEIMSLAFGEHAEVRRRDLSQPGGNAINLTRTQGSRNMTTLAQRIEALQNDINLKRDKLAELNAADDLDVDAVGELNDQLEGLERQLAVRKASEAKIGIDAVRGGGAVTPVIARRPLGFPQREVKGFDLLVRAITVRGVANFGPGNKTLERVLDERYPGHEATAMITKADQTIGTTTVSGWASELVQQTWGDFLDALRGTAVYPVLRDGGVAYSFDGSGTVNLPSLTAGGSGGGFFSEGSPIRVGRITTAASTMTSRSMGVIVPFSRKLAMQSTPSIESVVRQAILDDTSAILDGLMLDATAGDTVRPAGLLNGVSATATGYGGGDYRAVQEDFKALLAPFISANAANNITVVMNSSQGLSLALMDGPIGNPNWFGAISSRVKILESTHVTAGRLIAMRNSDLATALGDAPQFDVSEQAVVHMEDTTPLEIVSGTGPTTADPVRSFWQTGTVGIRMIADVSWKMRRSGMISWINGTSW